MDWTGGTRRRFAGAKHNTTLQRQKAHLARARAAVQHEPFSSRERSKGIDHNDDTQATSYKCIVLTLKPSRLRLLTRLGSGRDAVISERDDHKKTSTRQSRITNSTGVAQSHQDEELHLLASRRRLLARDDWLALDRTRPLRIGFSNAGDKDRVGRRRKIKKSSATRTNAAQRRPMTPLFEERLEPSAYLMSGALASEHDNHVEIKIGTGAFDSQSRPSRRSTVSRNAGMGAHSIALSCLSEESMLLGADGDTFDADQVEVPTYTHADHGKRQSSVRPASLEPMQIEPKGWGEYSSTAQEHSFALDDGPELQQYRALNADVKSPSPLSTPDDYQQTIGKSPTNNNSAAVSKVRSTGDARLTNFSGDIDRKMLVDPLIMAASTDQDALEADTEQAWRQLMGIVTQSESFTSNKALDSFSEHRTTSDIIHRVDPGDARYGAYISDTDSDARQCHGILNQAPPTQSHGMLVVDEQQSPHASRDARDDTDNEALWREFIIGSQDSESGDEVHSVWQRSRRRLRQSSEQPQSLQVSGLGTSDQATRGEATVCSPNPFASSRIASVDDFHEHVNASIETFPLDSTPEPNSPRNIHATLAKKLDPRRFKMPKESDASDTLGEHQEHAGSRWYSSRRFTGHLGRG